MKFILSLLCLCFISCAISCTSDQTAQTQASLNTANDQLTAQYNLLKAQVDSDNDVKSKAESQKALDEIIRLQTELAKIKTKVDASINSDGTVNTTGVMTAVGATLPFPWNLIVLVGIPSVVGIIQQLRLNTSTNAAKSLVNGINAITVPGGPSIPGAVTIPLSVDLTTHPAFLGQLTPKALKIVRSESIHSME